MGVPKKIDFVSKNGDLSVISGQFNYVFTSHVLEHQPDFTRHLLNVSKLLLKNGYYLLILPDRRYTFDYYDENYNIYEVLTAYYEKRQFHTLTSLLKSCHRTHNDVKTHWKGFHGENMFITKNDINMVLKKYYAIISERKYIDCHTWYFTPKSIKRILEELIYIGILPFSIEYISDTEENQLEFFVVLRKKV